MCGAYSARRLAFVVLCGRASLAAGGGFATRTPCDFASLVGGGRLRALLGVVRVGYGQRGDGGGS
ncbi:hypothetical protein GCM10009534_50390 [Kribbella sandramycini]